MPQPPDSPTNTNAPNQQSKPVAHTKPTSLSNTSIYSSSSSSSSTAPTQQSSLFSRANASTVPSSAFSGWPTKQPQRNLLRIPDNNEYEPAGSDVSYNPQQQYNNFNLHNPHVQPRPHLGHVASQRQTQPMSIPIPTSRPPSSVSDNNPGLSLEVSASPTSSSNITYSSSPVNQASQTNQTNQTSLATQQPHEFRQFPPISLEYFSFSRSNPQFSPSLDPPPPSDFSRDSQPQSTQLSIINVLQRLAENLTSCQTRANNRQGGGLLRISVEIDQVMEQALTSPPLQNVTHGSISVFSEPSLAVIVQVCLHFVDNVYLDPSMSTRRSTLLHKLFRLGRLLKILQNEGNSDDDRLIQPRIFAFGAAKEEIPGMEEIVSVLELMSYHSSAATADQDGAFIALVLRGLSSAFAVPTYYFGYPKVLPEHRQAMISFSDSFNNNAHFFCTQNYIRAASMPNEVNSLNIPPVDTISSNLPTSDFHGFMAPFRIAKNLLEPPISMSISTESLTSNVSGTLGGYIYPKVDPSNSDLADYAKSTYAVTCAHVCLVGENAYPRVTVPSVFMINVFRRLLSKERERYAVGTHEHHAYTKALNEVQTRLFPDGKLANTFGQVTWGEREIVGGQLSDIAIIKCDDNLKCRNTLGDDVNFSQFDAGLRFGCLDVKTVVRALKPGMKTFKYGSTTKYTEGLINGPKIFYWSEGKLQSSEFVVASGGPFANGGDSGAWVLHKNGAEQNAGGSIEESRAGPSLGVVGMLHSYDGERREFGLFTPMASILDRLRDVTGTDWGVVGVTEKGDDGEGGPGHSDTSEEEEPDDPLK